MPAQQERLSVPASGFSEGELSQRKGAELGEGESDAACAVKRAAPWHTAHLGKWTRAAVSPEIPLSLRQREPGEEEP